MVSGFKGFSSRTFFGCILLQRLTIINITLERFLWNCHNVNYLKQQNSNSTSFKGNVGGRKSRQLLALINRYKGKSRKSILLIIPHTP